jgi:hypothetical protein
MTDNHPWRVAMKRFAFLMSLMSFVFIGIVSFGYAKENPVD